LKLRIATFNCENLYSRPRVLNYVSNEKAIEPLARIALLDKILAKPTYSRADKERILRLVDSLGSYIRINALRGKLISRGAVKPAGRGDWVGGIELKRVDLPLAAQENTARVVREVAADVQCVVEVEDRFTLESFNRQFLPGESSYAYNMLIDGNDKRGIDVGLLTRFPILGVQTHIFDVEPGSPRRIFSRDCLEVTLALPDGERLYVLVNHFKSRIGALAYTAARRKAQAERVASILRKYDLARDRVVVAGDFNDTPESESLQALLDVPHLTDVLCEKYRIPADRWTYKTKEQLDYILVSRPLADAMVDVGLERRGLLDAERLTGGAVRQFATVTDDTNDARTTGRCAGSFEFDWGWRLRIAEAALDSEPLDLIFHEQDSQLMHQTTEKRSRRNLRTPCPIGCFGFDSADVVRTCVNLPLHKCLPKSPSSSHRRRRRTADADTQMLPTSNMLQRQLLNQNRFRR
jgi:endonuclease/exonuclease/phosphatase family metal-dependent hydrolase